MRAIMWIIGLLQQPNNAPIMLHRHHPRSFRWEVETFAQRTLFNLNHMWLFRAFPTVSEATISLFST